MVTRREPNSKREEKPRNGSQMNDLCRLFGGNGGIFLTLLCRRKKPSMWSEQDSHLLVTNPIASKNYPVPSYFRSPELVQTVGITLTGFIDLPGSSSRAAGLSMVGESETSAGSVLVAL